MGIKVTFKNNQYDHLITYSVRSKKKKVQGKFLRIQRRDRIIQSKRLSDIALERRFNLLKTNVIEELISKESEGISFGELVDQWYDFEFKEKRLYSATISDYYGGLRKWCFGIWDKPTEQITPREINKIFKMMKLEHKSMSHQQTLKTTINHVLRWGINEGAIDMDHHKLPTKGICAKRSSEKLPEILTYEQVKIFLAEAQKHDHPWYPVWLFALLTGCRNGEIYALRWENVSLETGFIKICESFNNRKNEFKSTKSGEYRTIPINADLRRLLTGLKLQTYHTGFVLPRLSGWRKGMQASVLRTFLLSIGLPSVRFHTLRACFATILLSQGQKPAALMKVCGWSNLKTMERYIRMAGIDEKGVTDSLQIMPQVKTGEILEGSFR